MRIVKILTGLLCLIFTGCHFISSPSLRLVNDQLQRGDSLKVVATGHFASDGGCYPFLSFDTQVFDNLDNQWVDFSITNTAMTCGPGTVKYFRDTLILLIDQAELRNRKNKMISAILTKYPPGKYRIRVTSARKPFREIHTRPFMVLDTL
jgi:hypothetical protein